MFDTRDIPVRFTHLKQMAKSPAHVLHAMRAGFTDPTISMRLGNGGHGLIFQPHKVIVWEGKVRNGKAWEAFKADHPDKIILNKREHALARGMADALLRHKEASRILLEDTVVENTIAWTAENGRKCSGTPDAYRRGSHGADLKTSKPLPPERFCREAMWSGYVSQLGWYKDGLARIGVETGDWFIVVVENVPPHVVTVFRVAERALEVGRRHIRLWWEQLMACESANEWPGYAQDTMDFHLDDQDGPSLIFPDEDDDDADVEAAEAF